MWQWGPFLEGIPLHLSPHAAAAYILIRSSLVLSVFVSERVSFPMSHLLIVRVHRLLPHCSEWSHSHKTSAHNLNLDLMMHTRKFSTFSFAVAPSLVSADVVCERSLSICNGQRQKIASISLHEKHATPPEGGRLGFLQYTDRFVSLLTKSSFHWRWTF